MGKNQGSDSGDDDMITRRNFMKVAVCALAMPTSIFASKPGLVWTTKTIDWGFQWYTVSKNGYSASFNGPIEVLSDCHGLCGTWELAYLVAEQLKYGEEGIRRLYKAPKQEVSKLKRQLLRTTLTKEEFNEIYNVIDELRGPHNCCWSDNDAASI